MKLLFLILTNMGTQLSKCFYNRIRQDGTILPRISKIETILLFLTIFGSAKYKIFGASRSSVPWTPTRNLPRTRWRACRTPNWIRQWPTVISPTGPTLFSYRYWQGPMIFADLWWQGSRLFLVPKLILHRPSYTVNIAGPLI